MRIALNGWFLAHSPHTGTGQYVRALLDHLPRVAPQHEVIAVVPDHGPQPAEAASVRFHRVRCGAGDLAKVWFEQRLFPEACRTLGADLAHVPPHWL